MTKWPKDTTQSLIAFYGDPRGTNGQPKPSFVKGLAKITPPFRMVASWQPGENIRTIQINARCAVALANVLERIWEASGKDMGVITDWGANLYGGTFNYRPKRGLSELSVHAFGAAIDLDPARNGLGNRHGAMAPEVVAAFKAEGAVWGGDFKSRADPMHFQFATI